MCVCSLLQKTLSHPFLTFILVLLSLYSEVSVRTNVIFVVTSVSIPKQEGTGFLKSLCVKRLIVSVLFCVVTQISE